MDNIIVPITFNDDSAIAFLSSLWSLKDVNEEVIIDFSNLKYAYPFGTLIMAEGIKHFSDYRNSNNKVFKTINSEKIYNANDNAISYLKFMGFFQHIGIPIGDLPNKEIIKDYYIPIKSLNMTDLEIENKIWQNNINNACDKIAAMLAKTNNVILPLSYIFREIIRNVFEHAETNYAIIMAQKNNIVEIAVIDRGIGILNSLRKKYQDLCAPLDAIKKALLPGESCEDINSTEKWSNEGFGLFILSEFAKCYGEFSIFSSQLYYHLQSNAPPVFKHIMFIGTGIKIRISLNDIDYFPNKLNQIINEGEKQFFERTGNKIKQTGFSRTKLF